jgi:hypothetical protein
MGHPADEVMRACLLATGLARRLGRPETEVADIYWTTLLAHAGCTAFAHEQAALFGGRRDRRERRRLEDRLQRAARGARVPGRAGPGPAAVGPGADRDGGRRRREAVRRGAVHGELRDRRDGGATGSSWSPLWARACWTCSSAGTARARRPGGAGRRDRAAGEVRAAGAPGGGVRPHGRRRRGHRHGAAPGGQGAGPGWPTPSRPTAGS